MAEGKTPTWQETAQGLRQAIGAPVRGPLTVSFDYRGMLLIVMTETAPGSGLWTWSIDGKPQSGTLSGDQPTAIAKACRAADKLFVKPRLRAPDNPPGPSR